MKRYVSLLLAGAVALGGLSGCGSAFEDSGETTAAVTAGDASGDGSTAYESTAGDGIVSQTARTCSTSLPKTNFPQ